MPIPNRGKRADANYIADMCNKLAKLAERDGFDTGTYLLRMANLEFKRLADQSDSAASNTSK
jgi:hypothetical protein